MVEGTCTAACMLHTEIGPRDSHPPVRYARRILARTHRHWTIDANITWCCFSAEDQAANFARDVKIKAYDGSYPDSQLQPHRSTEL